MKEKKSFHHIAVKSPDYDKSYDFYTRILEMEEALSWGEGKERACMLDIGDGTYIELFDGGDGYDEKSYPLIHFAIKVDNCDSFYKKAIDFGCSSRMEPTDLVLKAKQGDSPIRISFVYGPAGEEIEFFQQR